MQILVEEARAGAALRELDANIAGGSQTDYAEALNPHLLKWKEIETKRGELAANRPYPVGDVSRMGLDEPIFGLHNPPEFDRYLYQYTAAKTLPRIQESQAVKFRALAKMNDPQEALFSLAYQTGLIGPAGSSLVLSSEEAKAFRSTDWVTMINAARLSIKIGSYSTDAFPDLVDVDPDVAEYSVPRRLAANRGYAHPRMWAQYGDADQGVCLIFERARLEDAVKTAVDQRCAWGCGSVDYAAAEVDQSLGFFDARDLLRDGPMEALVHNYEPALFTKHADWADESEYRYFIANDSPRDFLIPIEHGVIVGLVLGPRFDTRDSSDVCAFARHFGILSQVRALTWVSGFAQLFPMDGPNPNRPERGGVSVSS